MFWSYCNAQEMIRLKSSAVATDPPEWKLLSSIG